MLYNNTSLQGGNEMKKRCFRVAAGISLAATLTAAGVAAIYFAEGNAMGVTLGAMTAMFCLFLTAVFTGLAERARP